LCGGRFGGATTAVAGCTKKLSRSDLHRLQPRRSTFAAILVPFRARAGRSPVPCRPCRDRSRQDHRTLRPQTRVCLETGLKLDINALRRAGTIPPALNGEKTGSLSVKYPEIGFEQEIAFVSRKRHFGGRQYYFVCPATGRLCSVLWKPPGATRFAPRQAWGNHRVAYRSQFACATSRAHLAKFKIQRRLSDKEWADLLPPRPQRMRQATFSKWETRWELQEKRLDDALLLAWRTKWSLLK
jgi:hypothetical protein